MLEKILSQAVPGTCDSIDHLISEWWMSVNCCGGRMVIPLSERVRNNKTVALLGGICFKPSQNLQR